MLRRVATAADPHRILAVGVALVLAAEYLRRTVHAFPTFPVQVAVGCVALWLCWNRRDRLRLFPLIGITVFLQVGWLLVRIHAAFGGLEPQTLYAPTGQQLLDGVYPHSEYPVGAVLLFALEAALHGASTHLVHGLLMVPAQVGAVAAVWMLRTRWSPWFAAAVAFWPVNAWFWEWRFDLVPTVLLAVGLVLALGDRWGWAGAVLAAGFAVKWTPGVAVIVLLAYLLATRERARALRLAVGTLIVTAALNLPFLLWSPAAVLAAYRRQGGRSITDESVWHLPLNLLGLEGRHGYRHPQFYSVDPPGWADTLAVVVQLAALVLIVWLATRARTLEGALALAALAPVVFLATNRVFSVQYFVLFEVAWALSASLVLTTGRDVLLAALAVGGATVANALIVPVFIPIAYAWELMSASRFALAFALTGWLAYRASAPDPQGAEVAVAVT